MSTQRPLRQRDILRPAGPTLLRAFRRPSHRGAWPDRRWPRWHCPVPESPLRRVLRGRHRSRRKGDS
eukprot:11173026-Lingulodinium_polyedra.AAC.1